MVLPPRDSYVLAKKTRHKFPTSQTMSEAIYSLIHVDLRGPYRHKTHNNFNSF